MVKLKNEIDINILDQLINVDKYIDWKNQLNKNKYKRHVFLLFIAFVIPMSGIYALGIWSMFMLEKMVPIRVYALSFSYVNILVLIYLMIEIIMMFIRSSSVVHRDRIASHYYLRRGIECVTYMGYFMLYSLGISGLVLSFRESSFLWIVDVVVVVSLAANIYFMYYFYKQGIHEFTKKELNQDNAQKGRRFFKRIWPLLGILALLSFVTAPASREFRERLYGVVTPFLVVLTIPYGYMHLCVVRKDYYSLCVMKAYSEEYRNALGESEVDFYGKNYMKSKSVMRKIETYKQSKNN